MSTSAPTAAPRAKIRKRSSSSSRKNSRSSDKKQAASPNPASQINTEELAQLIAGFGPLLKVAEPLIGKFRPVLLAVGDAVEQGVAALPDLDADDRAELSQVVAEAQAKVKAGEKLDMSAIFEAVKKRVAGAAKKSGRKAADDSTKAGAEAASTTPQAETTDTPVDSQAELAKIVSVLAPFARILAPVLSKYRLVVTTVGLAMVESAQEVDEKRIEATAKRIRAVTPDLIAGVKAAAAGDDEVGTATVLGIAKIAWDVHAPGGLAERLATGPYDQQELARFSKEKSNGMPIAIVVYAPYKEAQVLMARIRRRGGEIQDPLEEVIDLLEAEGYKIRIGPKPAKQTVEATPDPAAELGEAFAGLLQAARGLRG